MKLAKVVPIYKKNDKNDNNNYKPISILSNLSKTYEIGIQTQLNEYFAIFFGKIPLWLSTGIQNSTLSFGNDRKTSRFLLPSSLTYIKEFDSIPHQLLTTKTKCLWFWYNEISSFYFCVPQKPKTENKSWLHFQQIFEYIIWCPARYYFGASFISNIYYRCFLFKLWSRYCKLWKDTTRYICGHDFSNIINVLEPNVNKLFNWFRQNGLIENSRKNHFLANRYERRSLKIHASVITSSSSEELLRGWLIVTYFSWPYYKILL